MDRAVKGECEGAEPEMEELQDVGSGIMDMGDEEEIEELHKSLKEAVQDPSVKPKLQCLMVDPSFSMVTVQSEDSGIVWETASSRCSTPWASEGSSPSEQYSLEGSGTQGNIVIIMDEDRIKRKKTSSRGKLGERFKKSGSRVPKSRVGEERPAMIEVALPNIRPESSEDDLSAVSKDQDLFSLVSEGFEILNIVVPSKLATVDEEDSTELTENLAYLDNTPKIKSKPKHEPLEANGYCVSSEANEIKQNESLNDSSQISDDKQSKKDETQMDYLEKFTLLDEQAPSDGLAPTENLVAEVTVQPEVPPANQKESKADEPIEEDSFVIISDVEIAGELLDEVFYGSKSNAEPVVPQEHGRITRQSSKSLKESGSVLFGSQECILTPVYLPTGPPKIIDQVLLEEPRAMSFHYSDLYEDAIGDRKKEDEFSDTESVVSERSFKRRCSDSDDGDGYLEKFTLKDETPAAALVPEDKGKVDGGMLVWPQSKFELTGCLERAQEESDEVTVEQQCAPDKNKSEAKCESTGCCSNGHCGPEIQPKVEVIIKEKVISDDLVAKHRREDIKPCDITVRIKDTTITTKSESDDKHPPQVVEPKNKTTNKEEHGRQKPKGLTARIEVPRSLEHEDVSKTKDELEILSKTKISENIQVEIPHEVEKVRVSKDSIGKNNKSPDVITDIQKTNMITKFDKGEKDETQMQSKLLDKDKIQRVDKGKTEIVKNQAPEIFAQKVISIKETPTDKTELPKAKELPRVEKEDKPLKETSKASGVKHSAKSREIDSLVHQKGETLAVVEEKVSEGLTPKSEKHEKVIDIIGAVQEVDAQINSIEVLAEIKKKPESNITAVLRGSEQSHSSKIVTTTTELLTKPEITNETKMPPELENDSSSANNKAKEDIYVDRPTAEIPILKQSLEKQKKLIYIPEIEPKVTKKLEQVEEIKVDVVEESNKKAETTQEPVQEEIPSENRAKTEIEDIVESRQECSLLVNEKETSVPEVTENKSITADKEDSSKVRLSSVVPTKEVEFEEHSKINDVTTEIPVKENSEIKILPLASTLEKGKKTQIEDITDLPEPISPPPQVDEEDSSVMRVSPLEPEDSKKAYEEIHGGGISLSKNKGVFSLLRSYTPQEDLSALSFDPDVQRDIAEELDYEMIDEQEAKQSEQARTEDGKICLPDQALEMGFEFVEDLDSAQLADELEEDVEIQPMDAFCLDCLCPILLSEAEHQNHKVASLGEAFDSMKKRLSEMISVLQSRSENIEDFVSELEVAYNTVEENYNDCEKTIKVHNEEELKLVMDQYNEMSQAMEEQKKARLEQLYDQIVSFQENIDKAKETLETTAKEEEETDPLTFISKSKDISMRLNTALESTMSLELGPRGLLVFEDYAKGKSGNQGKNRQAIPVPQKPHLQPQEANSATSTSVTVYWRVNEDDIIDCFQVYCMEEPQGAISEEYRVTVKESYCNLEELEPDKCYKVWVMAVNYTGCSMPSERLPFKTAPSVPVINTEQCTVLWDSATLRWSSVQPSAVDSFTLEYCRQYACEREGLRSISGIKGYEQRVLLQPNENYLFYIKSVNAGGSSEQSEAALISTRGTRFHFLRESAHSVLKVSEDRNSVEYPHDTYNKMSSVIDCPSVMGEILQSNGYYYWETEVSRCKAYRIGIAYQTTSQTRTLGEDSASWCLHCVPTSISCRFELLHERVESDIFVTDIPARIGTLLDYSQGCLFFFNAQSGQVLGSFQHKFAQPCHPVFVLEQPGNLELKMTMEVPEFVKHC
ncbi:cardiomyopathy-associated protein 5 [Danio rerio]|uniref:Cardiomyopathy associated 5 like n=1 Tax=Danio rerio TaxID=7955 RepID=B3DJR0_DANRE|nr:cardiomyopathy-associated protein 5 [Danio rerio]AAI63573.1 Cardiomyopathy associated 5 like [Danio rerio]|eukprot:NP_001073454.3 cardiomyopathy associated 5 [Danio rerio]